MHNKPVKLSCRGVWKWFGEQAERYARQHLEPHAQSLAEAGLVSAVQEVNLEIHEGEIFVIMGLSGSGKSTLVRCLSRLVTPSRGEIWLGERNLLAASEKQMIDIRRHEMGMVFQHFALLPHLSVLGNVAFPLEIQGMPKAEREARAREVIELVGLKGREAYPPSALSGGQQQRVGIARSLAVEPSLWFLDEPFSALDPLIRREMQDEFMRLQNVLNKTIVFITHDFDEAIRVADRIAIMKDGRVIQVGTPEALVLKPVDEYVAEFTRHVPRNKVLSAGALMLAPQGQYAGEISRSQLLQSFAAEVAAAAQPFAVLDEQRQIVGQVGREQVIDALVART